MRSLLLSIALGLVVACPPAAAAVEDVHGETIATAERIRLEVEAESSSATRGLAVTEASSTAVVDSFALVGPAPGEVRAISAQGGVYYAVCPLRTSCPYPSRRLARPAADIAARRLALELAVRTFLHSSAGVVAVSLPTSSFVLFVVERDELDLARAADALRADAGLVDRMTRPHVFVPLGIETDQGGRDVLVAARRWQ